jgi:hypothetical protein
VAARPGGAADPCGAVTVPPVTTWHLAQLNLGLLRGPIDSDEMAEFRLALEPINAIAESSPGFVWRLTGDDGASSTYVDIPGIDDPLWAPNMSVWTDLDALRHFMHKSGHVAYLRRRREWFQEPPGRVNVLWWIPAGETPILADAVRRLRHLEANGPSQEGWDFRAPLDPPSVTSVV